MSYSSRFADLREALKAGVNGFQTVDFVKPTA